MVKENKNKRASRGRAGLAEVNGAYGRGYGVGSVEVIRGLRGFGLCVVIMVILLMSTITRPRISRCEDLEARLAAREVLEYLRAIEGKAWLTGQQEGQVDARAQIDKIWLATGRRPAVRGFDIKEDGPDPGPEVIRWWEEGGISTLSWHMGAPPYRDSYRNSKRKSDIERVLRAGTIEHVDFIEKLDRASIRLCKIQEAGVPVLWRPWHEMNGRWAWWSKDGPEKFKRLWVFTHRYFTERKHLNNLIWVWSTSFLADEGWYPGDEYVDVTGSDVYARDQLTDWVAIYRKLKRIAPSKPAALTECDVIPDPEDLMSRGASFVWFLGWRDRTIVRNSSYHLSYVYKHKCSITVETLRDFRGSH